MIQFPETAEAEWKAAEEVAKAPAELRQRIDRAAKVEAEVERKKVQHEADVMFQQELDAETTPVLEMLTLADYRKSSTTAPLDMIDGVMKDRGLCVVLGPSGSGKSTLTLQMLYSLMTGDNFLGQSVNQISGGVGLVSYDMDASMMMDWMAGFPNINPDKVSVVNAYRQGHPLGVAAMREKIVAAWTDMPVEVVVVDSFSASFFGSDQNDAAATMAHYRDLKKFALTEVGAKALIVITHSTDASPHKVRGSTVHKDASDTMVGVAVDPKTDKRTVTMVKYRAARGQKMMTPRVISAPDDVTHLVAPDTSEMSLLNFPIPPSLVGSRFPDVAEEPDTTIDEEEETE